jgi:hypothetical protein
MRLRSPNRKLRLRRARGWLHSARARSIENGSHRKRHFRIATSRVTQFCDQAHTADALLKLIRLGYIIPSLGTISGSIVTARRLMIRFARATLRPARRGWRAPFRATRRTFRTTLRPARRTLRATLRPVRRDTRADRRARRLVRRRALRAFLSALAIVCLLRKTHHIAVVAVAHRKGL